MASRQDGTTSVRSQLSHRINSKEFFLEEILEKKYAQSVHPTVEFDMDLYVGDVHRKDSLCNSASTQLQSYPLGSVPPTIALEERRLADFFTETPIISVLNSF